MLYLLFLLFLGAFFTLRFDDNERWVCAFGAALAVFIAIALLMYFPVVLAAGVVVIFIFVRPRLYPRNVSFTASNIRSR